MNKISLATMLDDLQNHFHCSISTEEFLSLTPKEAKRLYRRGRKLYLRYAKAKRAYFDFAPPVVKSE